MLDVPGGCSSPVPYLQVPELRVRSLYPRLMRMLEHLLGKEMLLHLTLTGWVGTERNWHRDDYLNPPHVNSWYAAVWMAGDVLIWHGRLMHRGATPAQPGWNGAR